MRTWRRRLALAATTLLLALPVQAEKLNIFAAASLQGALDEVAGLWMDESGDEAVITYAGSSVLARQILQGAPADVFFSANMAWMQVLADEGRVDPAEIVDLLGNRLVLVTARTAGGEMVEITPEYDLLANLGNGRLVMAMVDAVPAGIYGRQALEQLNLWDGVQARVAQTDNVRAALALVALGEAPMGVVYATDAEAEPRVTVVGTLPAAAHAPVIYPVAALRGAVPAAVRFVGFLNTTQSAAAFRRHGFRVLADE